MLYFHFPYEGGQVRVESLFTESLWCATEYLRNPSTDSPPHPGLRIRIHYLRDPDLAVPPNKFWIQIRILRFRMPHKKIVLSSVLCFILAIWSLWFLPWEEKIIECDNYNFWGCFLILLEKFEGSFDTWIWSRTRDTDPDPAAQCVRILSEYALLPTLAWQHTPLYISIVRYLIIHIVILKVC